MQSSRSTASKLFPQHRQCFGILNGQAVLAPCLRHKVPGHESFNELNKDPDAHSTHSNIFEAFSLYQLSDSFHNPFTIPFNFEITKAQKLSQGMRSNKPWVPVVCFGAGTVAAVPWTWTYHFRRPKEGKKSSDDYMYGAITLAVLP